MKVLNIFIGHEELLLQSNLFCFCSLEQSESPQSQAGPPPVQHPPPPSLGPEAVEPAFQHAFLWSGHSPDENASMTSSSHCNRVRIPEQDPRSPLVWLPLTPGPGPHPGALTFSAPPPASLKASRQDCPAVTLILHLRATWSLTPAICLSHVTFASTTPIMLTILYARLSALLACRLHEAGSWSVAPIASI